MEGVDRDLFLGPEDGWRRDVERRQRYLCAAPHRRPVRGRSLPWRKSGGIEQAADDPPAGAVAPVRKAVEASLGKVVLESGDAQRLGGGASRRTARLALSQLRLERAG